MKTLLSTTAVILAMGFPAMTFAQTAVPAANQATQTETPGFLGVRGQSDVFASELIGHDVYARRAPADMSGAEGSPGLNADGTHSWAMLNRADLDGMDNIGQINEIVLSSDGQVRAIVIGVGGFLGIGERDVAVTMDQVTFASDPDDLSLMHIVVNIGADMLTDSPHYDRTAMTGERVPGAHTAPVADRTAFTAPELARDGYDRVEITQVSTEMLVGKSVYGVNDEAVGTIDDLIVDDAGGITNVIIDFGGFLGIGATQVSLGFEELTILANEGSTDVRVYVDATKEQVQALPPYSALN